MAGLISRYDTTTHVCLAGLERTTLADCETSLPPHEAATVAPGNGNPQRFQRSTKWIKVIDDFIHERLGFKV